MKHFPTDAQRKTARTMALWEYPQAAIAREIGVCVTTLRRHYPAELAATMTPEQESRFRDAMHRLGCGCVHHTERGAVIAPPSADFLRGAGSPGQEGEIR